MNKKIVSILKMLSLTLVLLLVSLRIMKDGKGQAEDEEKTEYYFAMGTVVDITMYGDSIQNNLNKQIVDRINQLSDNIISWRSENSQLYLLNNSYKTGEEYPIDNELREILTMSYKICKDSKGALDITIRPLANLWNIEEANEDNFIVPSEADIETALSKTGYQNIEFTDDGLVLKKDDMILDFGATGKGYALDVIRDEYIREKADGCILSIGGSVLLYGSKPDNKPWTIGIRDPFGQDGDVLGYLSFTGNVNLCISTSGDYEKYIEKDGIRYHHILDTKTGYPANRGLSSVTVVCENGLASDGLSTACFVLGYEKSLPVLEQYQAEAVFVTNQGEIMVTDGLKDKFTLKEE